MPTDHSLDSATATTRRSFLARAAVGGALVTAGAVAAGPVSGLLPAASAQEAGTWTLTETTVPAGYAAGAPVTVDLPRSGSVLQLDDITNTENGRVTWTKVDEDGTTLAGAGFTLTMDGQHVVVDDFTGQPGYEGRDRDADAGEFTVDGLDFGTWTLAETTVPVGYTGAVPRTFTALRMPA